MISCRILLYRICDRMSRIVSTQEENIFYCHSIDTMRTHCQPYRLDTKTQWAGTYLTKSFQVRASSPDNTFTGNNTITYIISPVNPNVSDGAYIIKGVELSVNAIGLSIASHTGIKSLMVVEVDDKTNLNFTAFEIADNIVQNFVYTATEAGPTDPANDALVNISTSCTRI